jgi:pyruvate,water dikinase
VTGAGAQHTRPLTDLRRADEPRFGGKSASLGELLGAGVPVPAGFAVATAADSPELLAEIAAAYAALGDDPAVAVRSSAIGEDSADATFAGQHDTYLWVRGADAVCAAVRDCWASLENPEAVSYRERLGDSGPPAMGVTVQLMVDAQVSGVMFTCNPVTGDPSTVAVNASWGLGSAVVAGEVTPDEYRINKVTGEVTVRTIGPKEVEDVPHPEGEGTTRLEVPAERREAACLDDAALASLVDLGKRIERHFGSHQDIEWALSRDGGELFVLQSRPVTARPQSETPAPQSALSLVMKTFGAGRDT